MKIQKYIKTFFPDIYSKLSLIRSKEEKVQEKSVDTK